MPFFKRELSSDPKSASLVPSLFALSAIFPALGIIMLAKQPKEVSAAVYSAYVAVLAVFATAVFSNKGKRGAAITALVVCTLFTALFVVNAYQTYKL